MRILFVTSTTFSVTLIVQLLQDIAKEHLTTNSIIEMTPVSLKLVFVNFKISAKFQSKFLVFGRKVVFESNITLFRVVFGSTTTEYEIFKRTANRYPRLLWCLKRNILLRRGEVLNSALRYHLFAEECLH